MKYKTTLYHVNPALPSAVSIMCHKCIGMNTVRIKIKGNSVWYFDSIGMPPGLSMNSNILERLKKTRKDIYWSKKSIQGIKSLYCGYYCMNFLVKCLKENVEYRDFLSLYKSRKYSRNEKVCKGIIKKAMLKQTEC